MRWKWNILSTGRNEQKKVRRHIQPARGFFAVRRIASDVAILRKQGMYITLTHVTISDNLTKTVHDVPAYFSPGSP
jgi:hypothetical protein